MRDNITMATDAEQPPADDAEEQVTHWLRQSVQQQKWTYLLRLMQKEQLSAVQSQWLIQQICDGDNTHVAKDLANKCPHEHLDCVLQQLVVRRNWRAVGAALQRGVSDPLLRWAVEEAGSVASDDDFRFHVVHFCPDDMLHSVVKGMVGRGQWRGVGGVLLRGATDAIFITIVEAILTLPEPSQALVTVMNYTQQDRLIWALKELLTRASLDVDVAHDDLVLEWFVQQVVGKVEDEGVIKDYIVPLSPVGQSSWLCSHLVTRGLWKAAAAVVQGSVCSAVLGWALSPSPKPTHCVSDSKMKHGGVAVPQDGSKPEDFALAESNALPHDEVKVQCEDDSRAAGSDAAQTSDASDVQHDDSALWRLVADCKLRTSDVSKMLQPGSQTKREDWPVQVYILQSQLQWSELTLNCFFVSVMHLVCSLLAEQDEHVHPASPDRPTEQAEVELSRAWREVMEYVHHDPTVGHEQRQASLQSVVRAMLRFECASLDQRVKDSLILTSLSQFIRHFHLAWTTGGLREDILLEVLSVTPLLPLAQVLAMSKMLRDKRWDVVRHASLCHVPDECRRVLVKTAVEEGRWSLVGQYLDTGHSLYDDQRVFLLEKAIDCRQWDIVQRLADSMTENAQRVAVLARVAQHADWDTVMNLVASGADLTDINRHQPDGMGVDECTQRRSQLQHLEEELRFRAGRSTVEDMIQEGDWPAVLFKLRQSSTKDGLALAVQAAVAEKAWPIVVQLVALGTDTDQRDSLLSQMVEAGCWGVCEALLQHGVSIPLSLHALPFFIHSRQWNLVSRALNLDDVSDDVRRHVIRRGMECGEGTVVGQAVLALRTPLTVEEREDIFTQALTHDCWQALPPLVSVADSTGHRHRDTVVVAAARHEQWWLVDECLRHGADVNLALEMNGELTVDRLPEWPSG